MQSLAMNVSRMSRISLAMLSRFSQVRCLATRQESRPWKQKPNRKVKISVILAENVPGLGKRGEEVQVRRGFARNYLIPSKQAVYNTETNKALFKEEKNVAGQADGDQILDSATQKIVDFVSQSVVKIKRRDDPRGWALYPQHISMACRKQFQLHVPLDRIQLSGPLSSFGVHEVVIRVTDNAHIPIRVEVVRDENSNVSQTAKSRTASGQAQ